MIRILLYVQNTTVTAIKFVFLQSIHVIVNIFPSSMSVVLEFQVLLAGNVDWPGVMSLETEPWKKNKKTRATSIAFNIIQKRLPYGYLGWFDLLAVKSKNAKYWLIGINSS